MDRSASDRLGLVRERIATAARRAGRQADDITLVGVTKTVPFERVLPFLQAGLVHFGENRVQEAQAKFQAPDGARRLAGTLHLIGQLQTNKAKKAVQLFDMVQSLDRLDLADALNTQARALGRRLDCLVEVKISPEPSKSGLLPEDLERFLAELETRRHLDIRGLMGIAPLATSAEEARPFFRQLRELLEKTQLAVLSMGMTQDFEVAIEEGSTMVRLGTALFGQR